MRKFFRHEFDMPIEVEESGYDSLLDPDTPGQLQDISVGGLSLHVDQPVLPGRQLLISIPYVEPPLKAEAEVAWCRPNDREGGYDVGAGFLDTEIVAMTRMLRQLQQIEDLREAAMRDGGQAMTTEQAAAEWLDRQLSGEGPLLH
ncbi:PilZ domain-containing protein [Pelomonas sp. SE-A7]|uniref:PilZ domain-containing protein n=1 Tax=Pelomonas sp. SE-A7 TaxID=3054953 RepID=UPI00259C6A1F|nr:PilZ domain-containing protein [Pelomonas sp. SE-A7]MDM4766201.1 PilZ domain-containing protein [Pelomonas sp. SE-A7]